MTYTPSTVFTIGHSTRTIEAFVDLVRAGSVEVIIDIRKTPFSRTNPQYNTDVLPQTLQERQLGYERIEELGGRRGKSKAVDPEVNAYWQNQSFHNYADYTLSNEFRTGLERLQVISRERTCAIMCSEAVWWRCHRRFVADYLIATGRSVIHIMDGPRLEAAKLTPAAQLAGGVLVYPLRPSDAHEA